MTVIYRLHGSWQVYDDAGRPRRDKPAVERHHLVKVAVIFEMSVGWTRVGSLGKSIGV